MATAAEEVPLISWGKTYDSPKQQVGALFSKIAGTYGAPRIPSTLPIAA